MPKKKMTDTERVMRVGFTEQEAECWELASSLANRFMHLPQIHEVDIHEVVHAIHVIQNKLMSRPAYRKYLELAPGNIGPGKGIVEMVDAPNN
jgi:hypothetical protein